MNFEGFKKKLIKLAMSLEIIIALFIGMAIVLGMFTLVRYLGTIIHSDISDIYTTLKKFLSIALLMVVGVELVLMLLSHSTSSILELVLFAVARKMLVYSETMMDLILGTLAIAIVFAVKKYLMSSKYTKYISEEGKIISAASPIHDLNFSDGFHLPENKATTVGGLICNLSEETCTPVEEGAVYSIGDLSFKILKMKDGLIEKVLLKEKTKETNED